MSKETQKTGDFLSLFVVVDITNFAMGGVALLVGEENDDDDDVI